VELSAALLDKGVRLFVEQSRTLKPRNATATARMVCDACSRLLGRLSQRAVTLTPLNYTMAAKLDEIVNMIMLVS